MASSLRAWCDYHDKKLSEGCQLYFKSIQILSDVCCSIDYRFLAMIEREIFGRLKVHDAGSLSLV